MAAESGFAKGLAAVAGTQCDSREAEASRISEQGTFIAHTQLTAPGLCMEMPAKPTLWCYSILEIAKIESVQMRLCQDFLEEMNPLCIPDIHRKGKL